MEQAASFKAYPHIGEKVFGYLTNQEDFKNCHFVCKSWFKILDNPRFWMNKLKESNMPDDVMQKWMNVVLNFKDLANTELAISLRERYFLISVNVPITMQTISIPYVNGLFTYDPMCQTVLSCQQRYNLIQKEFRCEICNISFRKSEDIRRHKRSTEHFSYVIANLIHHHYPNSSNQSYFYCEDCKIGYRSARHFAMHLNSKAHHLKLQTLGFECDSCSSRYHESKAKVLMCLENFGKIPQGSLAEMLDIWEFFHVTQCKLCGSWYEGSYKKHLQSYLHFYKSYMLI